MPRVDTSWVRVEVGEAGDIDIGPGVYAAFSCGTPVYVGASEDLGERILTHCRHSRKAHREWMFWTRLPGLYFKIRSARKFGEQMMAEARLIYKLRSVGNTNGKNTLNIFTGAF